MTMLYPIVLETEESGAVSAYVPGLPVYAAAETHAKAERAIRTRLDGVLKAHPASRPAHGSAWHVSPIAGGGESESLESPLWSARVAAPQRRVLREPTAGSAVALRKPRPHERLRRRHRAEGSPRRVSHLTITPRAAACPPGAAICPAGSNSQKCGSPFDFTFSSLSRAEGSLMAGHTPGRNALTERSESKGQHPRHGAK